MRLLRLVWSPSRLMRTCSPEARGRAAHQECLIVKGSGRAPLEVMVAVIV